MARYGEGRYADALVDHVSAADLLHDHPVERMAALNNAAAAALETGEPSRAEALGREASELGRRLRHAVTECGATNLVRSARYRAGTRDTPRPDLVDAAARVSRVHEAQHALTEAAASEDGSGDIDRKISWVEGRL